MPEQMAEGNQTSQTRPPQRKSRGNELVLTHQPKGQQCSQKGQEFQAMTSLTRSSGSPPELAWAYGRPGLPSWAPRGPRSAHRASIAQSQAHHNSIPMLVKSEVGSEIAVQQPKPSRPSSVHGSQEEPRCNGHGGHIARQRSFRPEDKSQRKGQCSVTDRQQEQATKTKARSPKRGTQGR